MNIKLVKVSMAIILSLLLLWSYSTAAHHGWSWAEDKQTEMTGVITEISISPPHQRLMIDTADGPWQVDLGNPRQTRAAGFVDGEAKVGDTVLVRGHRSAKSDEHLIKAVRVTINGKQYTFYPQLVRED